VRPGSKYALGMPGAEGIVWGRGRRRQAILLAGLGLAMAACGSPPPAPPASTLVPPAIVRSAVADAPLNIGQAATFSTGGPTGEGGPLLLGTAADDTVGGFIADNQHVSPFDVDNPAIALLDPLLRKAIQDAAQSVQGAGIALEITSGWRSKGFQQRLFDDALRTYGSNERAAEFVASPDVSKHVLGEAVDVGPVAADNFLMRNGAQFGLCQIYANEIWHFERVADARGQCPPLRANAAG
jgi:zinc D-Ala-D-Ala carboxypeptidase